MVEEIIDMRDKEAFIASVVERMPEQRRKVFVMSRMEHKSNDEIAALPAAMFLFLSMAG